MRPADWAEYIADLERKLGKLTTENATLREQAEQAEQRPPFVALSPSGAIIYGGDSRARAVAVARRCRGSVLDTAAERIVWSYRQHGGSRRIRR